MTITRKLATTVALLAASGVAAATDAPIVSIQHTSKATKAPVTIPGTGIQKGERLPKGARLVYLKVTLEGDQTAKFNLRAPHGKRLRGLATRSEDVGFAGVDRADYANRSKVTVRAFADARADGPC